MATMYKLNVITPDKIFFGEETSQIVVRTTEGDVGILAGHVSLVADLPSGPLKIMMPDGNFKVAALSSGLLKVGKSEVSIIANAVEWSEEIDMERALRSETDARERIEANKSKHDFDLAELKLKRALNRINIKNNH